MEEIRSLLNKAAELAEEREIPLICAFGVDKVSVIDYMPLSAPERLKKTRNALVSGARHTRQEIVIQD